MAHAFRLLKTQTPGDNKQTSYQEDQVNEMHMLAEDYNSILPMKTDESRATVKTCGASLARPIMPTEFQLRVRKEADVPKGQGQVWVVCDGDWKENKDMLIILVS